MTRPLGSLGTRLGIVGVLAAAALGLLVYYTMYREAPAPHYASDEEHFFYGSIGTEAEAGVPYWIWLVLPRIFPEYLPQPGGYAALGILSAGGREMPIGFSKATAGVPRVGVNCALCHTTRFRTLAGGPATLVAGGPANVTAPQRYLQFLVACASDPRFTADVILAEIARNHRLSAYERLMYRFVIVPRTRERLIELKERSAWMDRNPEAGPGRADLSNMAKFHRLEQPADATVGNADAMPLWNMAPKAERPYGWDGSNTDFREVMQAQAATNGAGAGWLERDFAGWDGSDPDRGSSLRRVLTYMTALRPPRYPLSIDRVLAERGEAVFAAQCAECHAPEGPRTHTVIPIEEVGTDRHRLVAWTAAAAAAYNEFGDGRRWAFSKFGTTAGYVAVPLDGLWLRGPYLHNGSVPTLGDLLAPVESRPAAFWRGSDVLDGEKVGFASDGPDAEAAATWFDTSLPGNGRGGHLYGTTLDEPSRRALLEYLKTL